MIYQSVKLYTGKDLKKDLSAEQLAKARKAAESCIASRRHATSVERSVVAAKAAAVLPARADRFAHPMKLEMGKFNEWCKEFWAQEAGARGADFPQGKR